MNSYKRQQHVLEPFYNPDSEILILGTLPSVKSREANFYYMHPQNRFWSLLGTVFNEHIGPDITDKKLFLTKHKIALWDVCSSCEINGSSDASIKNISVNDVNQIISKSKIKHIYTTGKKAFELYNKYLFEKTKIEAIYLYSPSPANCAIPLEKMLKNYETISKIS